MDKPIILQIKETEDKIINIINDSNLPAFFLVRIVEKIYKELQPIETSELIKAKEIYNSNEDKRKKAKEK